MECKSLTKYGNPCKAKPMANGYCFKHNPETREQDIQSCSEGGKANKHSIPDLEAVEINSVQDIPDFIVSVINEVRTGETDIKTANAMGYLTGHLIKAYDTAELEKRIEAIENNLNDNGLNNDS
jgi:hypothetical protein